MKAICQQEQSFNQKSSPRSFDYPTGDEDCIWLVRILHIRVIEHTIIFVMQSQMLQVIRRPGVQNVVSKNNSPHSNRAQTFKLQKVRQVESFHMVDKDEVEQTVILHKTFQALQDTLMHDDSILDSCMLMDFLGDICPKEIGLYGVDNSFGMGSHEQRRETDIAAQFKDSFGGVLLKSIDEDEPLILPHVHHPVLAAECIDAIQNDMGISFRC